MNKFPYFMTTPDRTSVCKEVRQMPYWGEFLPHLPYSPDLAFSKIHPFGPLKDALRGRRFADDDVLEHGEPEELRASAKGFTRLANSVSHKAENAVDNESDFVVE
jgi:hypothetical protein